MKDVSTPRRVCFVCCAVLGSSVATIAIAHEAAAATISCSTSSLISAISAANSTSGGGTVSLASSCTYVLTQSNNTSYYGNTGLPLITGKVTVIGNGATIERASSLQCTASSSAGCFRIFSVGATGKLTLSTLTLENGAAQIRSAGLPHHEGGGAIWSRGVVSVTGVTFIDNTAADPNTEGGGAVDFHDRGTFTVSDSTFIGNSATQAGAVINEATDTGASMSIIDSTFSDNSSLTYDGGAVESLAGTSTTLSGDTFVDNQGKGGAAVYAAGTMAIDNSTFTDNVGGTDGGGAIQNSGQLTITRSTLSGNSAPYGANIHTYQTGGSSPPTTMLAMTIVANGQGGGGNCSGTDPVTDGGYNIDTGTSCGFSAIGSLSNTNPQLQPLANNGGPTETMALPSTSPAVDAVPPTFSLCSGVDQRGVTRPQGPRCDIGAFELVEKATAGALATARKS